MINEHKIEHTTPSDLPLIFSLFDQSIHYQEQHGYPVWRNYDKSAIIRDVENNHQYKIIVDDAIGLVFSVCYTDKLIWRERDRDDAIYLHRIVVNPACKGRKLFGVALDWAIDHARELGRASIRMDTWADNPTIIDYYKRFGFVIIENYTTPDTPDLPVHNRNLAMTLLAYEVHPGKDLADVISTPEAGPA